jgi:hypothetical protein
MLCYYTDIFLFYIYVLYIHLFCDLKACFNKENKMQNAFLFLVLVL